MQENVSGSYNTALGNEALKVNTSGYYNTALGWHALPNNTTGAFNTAVGMVALRSNTTGGGEYSPRLPCFRIKYHRLSQHQRRL